MYEPSPAQVHPDHPVRRRRLHCQCAQPVPAPPAIAPATQPSAGFAFDSSAIRPMYRELARHRLAHRNPRRRRQNLDIQQARQRASKHRRGNMKAASKPSSPSSPPSSPGPALKARTRTPPATRHRRHFTNSYPPSPCNGSSTPAGRVRHHRLRPPDGRIPDAGIRRHPRNSRHAAVQYLRISSSALARLAVARKVVAEAKSSNASPRPRLRAGTGLPGDDSRPDDLAVPSRNRPYCPRELLPGRGRPRAHPPARSRPSPSFP